MDKIFKIGLLVLGFGYLAYLFCPVVNQVGRYQYYEDSGSITVLDTATADMYSLAPIIEGGSSRVWFKKTPVKKQP